MGRGDLGHMEGIVLPQGGFCDQSITAGLEPPLLRAAVLDTCSSDCSGWAVLMLQHWLFWQLFEDQQSHHYRHTQRVQKVKLEFIHSHKFSHCHNMWGFLASCKLQVWISTVLDLPALVRFSWPLLPYSRFSSLVSNATVFYHIMPWYHATAWPKTNLWMGSRNIYFTCFLWLQDLNLSW